MIEVVHACVPVPVHLPVMIEVERLDHACMCACVHVHLPVMIEVERLDGIRELRKGLDL